MRINFSTAKPTFNSITAQIVYPAPPKLIKKYTKAPMKLISETEELWRKITKPYTESIPKSEWKWIYNILDEDAEAEKTFFKDKDKSTGFTLCLDLDAGSDVKETFHCLALVERRDVLSIRDLNASHLPLLRKLAGKGLDEVSRRFEVPKEEIRAYFHYHPSFYHLHLHYSHVELLEYGVTTERAHLISDVIQNIEMVGDYYQRVTLDFPIRTTNVLFEVVEKEATKLGLKIFRQ